MSISFSLNENLLYGDAIVVSMPNLAFALASTSTGFTVAPLCHNCQADRFSWENGVCACGIDMSHQSPQLLSDGYTPDSKIVRDAVERWVSTTQNEQFQPRINELLDACFEITQRRTLPTSEDSVERVVLQNLFV